MHGKDTAVFPQLQWIGESRGGSVPRAGGGHWQIAAWEDYSGHQQTAAHGKFPCYTPSSCFMPQISRITARTLSAMQLSVLSASSWDAGNGSKAPSTFISTSPQCRDVTGCPSGASHSFTIYVARKIDHESSMAAYLVISAKLTSSPCLEFVEGVLNVVETIVK